MIISRFKISIFIICFSLFFLHSCTKVRESAGVTRKSLDEFQAVENPPLVIPPDFNLLPPDQLEEKDISDLDKEFAKEILFGLENNDDTQNVDSSTMNLILEQTDAKNTSSDIRKEIDENFNKEKKTNKIYQVTWTDEQDVLDAIKESERIREQNFKGESLSEGEVAIKKEKVKKKKKKRFFFF